MKSKFATNESGVHDSVEPYDCGVHFTVDSIAAAALSIIDTFKIATAKGNFIKKATQPEWRNWQTLRI